jgi:hypothetical protein
MAVSSGCGLSNDRYVGARRTRRLPTKAAPGQEVKANRRELPALVLFREAQAARTAIEDAAAGREPPEEWSAAPRHVFGVPREEFLGALEYIEDIAVAILGIFKYFDLLDALKRKIPDR